MALLGDRMTLAVILLCCVSLSSWASPNSQTAISVQQNPPTTEKPSAVPAQPTAGAPAKPKLHRHKKRVADPCTTTSSTPPAATQSGETAANTAPTNCPPPKVIVRQGGTSEPSIQLGGGSGGGDQAAQQKNSANQLLGSTTENLKKIEGRQLTADQQDMVNQIKQFTEQSKSARDAGDLERARTLAWKAQRLSEELVKPPQ